MPRRKKVSIDMTDSFTGTNDFTMTWKIRNFSYTWQDLISEPFIARCFNETKFFMHLEYDGSEDSKEIKVYIVGKNKSLPPVDYEVSLVALDGSPEISLKQEEFAFKNNIALFDLFCDWKTETLVVPLKTIMVERRNAFLPQDTLTIQCRLQQRGVECSTSEESFLCSSIGVRRKSFAWTLDGSNSDWEDKHAILHTVWGTFGHLTLKASFKEECDESVVFEVQRDKGEKIFSTLKLSLLNAEGTVKGLVSDSFFLEKNDKEQIWQSPPLISKSELAKVRSEIQSNDSLSLKCEFATSLGLINETEEITCSGEFVSYSNDLQETRFSWKKSSNKTLSGSLQRDLRCVLDTGALSDLKLKVDSDVFPVHKAVLGARSPTFCAMLTSDYKEKSSGQVQISDIDADTMKGFLTYLYTDTVDSLNMDNAAKLYFAADKYEVLCLKEICASFLKANLSSSSVCATLILADLHGDKEMKDVAINFISRHDSEIIRSKDWQNLEKSNHLLGLETLREICLKKSTK